MIRKVMNMIELSIKNGQCKSKIIGGSSELIHEILLAQVSLTKTISEVMNMSYESASIFLMQQGNKIHGMMNEYKEE